MDKTLMVAKLMSSHDRQKRLSSLSDKQLAELLLDEVWSEEEIMSYKSDIISAAIDRLCGVGFTEEIDWGEDG